MKTIGDIFDEMYHDGRAHVWTAKDRLEVMAHIIEGVARIVSAVKDLNFWVTKMEGIGKYEGLKKVRRLMGNVLSAVFAEYPEYREERDAIVYQKPPTPEERGRLAIYPTDLERLMLDARFKMGDKVVFDMQGSIMIHTITGRGIRVMETQWSPVLSPLRIQFYYQLNGKGSEVAEDELKPATGDGIYWASINHDTLVLQLWQAKYKMGECVSIFSTGNPNMPQFYGTVTDIGVRQEAGAKPVIQYFYRVDHKPTVFSEPSLGKVRPRYNGPAMAS